MSESIFPGRNHFYPFGRLYTFGTADGARYLAHPEHFKAHRWHRGTTAHFDSAWYVSTPRELQVLYAMLVDADAEEQRVNGRQTLLVSYTCEKRSGTMSFPELTTPIRANIALNRPKTREKELSLF